MVADRNSRQKHVWQAQIILATGEGCGTTEIMRRAGLSKACVWRWQERFMREGMSRPAGRQDAETRSAAMAVSASFDDVVALTLAEPPSETTHWTGRAMSSSETTSRCARCSASRRRTGLAAAPGAAVEAVAGPAFAAKLRDVVELYLDPPAHSLVLETDRREEQDAGPRPHPGKPADQKGPGRNDDP